MYIDPNVVKRLLPPKRLALWGDLEGDMWREGINRSLAILTVVVRHQGLSTSTRYLANYIKDFNLLEVLLAAHASPANLTERALEQFFTLLRE